MSAPSFARCPCCGQDLSEPIARLAGALTDPARVRVFASCAEGVSPKQIAARQEGSAEKAAGHCEALLEAGLIRVLESARYRTDVRYEAMPWALELHGALGRAVVRSQPREEDLL